MRILKAEQSAEDPKRNLNVSLVEFILGRLESLSRTRLNQAEKKGTERDDESCSGVLVIACHFITRQSNSTESPD